MCWHRLWTTAVLAGLKCEHNYYYNIITVIALSLSSVSYYLLASSCCFQWIAQLLSLSESNTIFLWTHSSQFFVDHGTAVFQNFNDISGDIIPNFRHQYVRYAFVSCLHWTKISEHRTLDTRNYYTCSLKPEYETRLHIQAWHSQQAKFVSINDKMHLNNKLK